MICTEDLSSPQAVIQRRELYQRWMAVGKAWQDQHPACEDCPHRRSFEERHPYGDTYAVESFSECVLGACSSDQPEQCPALQTEGESA